MTSPEEFRFREPDDGPLLEHLTNAHNADNEFENVLSTYSTVVSKQTRSNAGSTKPVRFSTQRQKAVLEIPIKNGSYFPRNRFSVTSSVPVYKINRSELLCHCSASTVVTQQQKGFLTSNLQLRGNHYHVNGGSTSATSIGIVRPVRGRLYPSLGLSHTHTRFSVGTTLSLSHPHAVLSVSMSKKTPLYLLPGKREYWIRASCSTKRYTPNALHLSLSPDSPASSPKWNYKCYLNAENQWWPLLGLNISKLSKHVSLDVSLLKKVAGWTYHTAVAYKPSPQRSFGVGFNLNSAKELQAMSWIVSLTEGDFSLRIPILLTPFQTTNIFLSEGLQFLYAGFVSSIVSELVSTMVSRRRSIPDLASIEGKIESNKRDALTQQSFMRRQAAVRMRVENESNGLVIERASYSYKEATLDVTIPLQFWVTDSRLELYESAKRKDMLGFCSLQTENGDRSSIYRNEDEQKAILGAAGFLSKWIRVGLSLVWSPSDSDNDDKSSPAARPELKVWYKYRGASYFITIGEAEEISLPSERATPLN